MRIDFNSLDTFRGRTNDARVLLSERRDVLCEVLTRISTLSGTEELAAQIRSIIHRIDSQILSAARFDKSLEMIGDTFRRGENTQIGMAEGGLPAKSAPVPSTTIISNSNDWSIL